MSTHVRAVIMSQMSRGLLKIAGMQCPTQVAAASSCLRIRCVDCENFTTITFYVATGYAQHNVPSWHIVFTLSAPLSVPSQQAARCP